MIPFLDSLSPTEKKIFDSIVIFVLLYTFRSLAHLAITRQVQDIRARYKWRQSATVAAMALAGVLVIWMWFEWVRSALTLISVVAAGIVIVCKEILQNLFSYGIILWRGLFKVGDRVQIGTTIGDVIELGPVYISIAEAGNWASPDAASGRVVKVPNSLVLTQPVGNYSRGQNLIWNEMSLEIPLSRNWEKAKNLLLSYIEAEAAVLTEEDLADLRATNEEIIFVRQRPQVYVRVEKETVVLTMRYLCKFYKKRVSEDRIWTAILREFPRHADLAFTEKGTSKTERA